MPRLLRLFSDCPIEQMHAQAAEVFRNCFNGIDVIAEGLLSELEASMAELGAKEDLDVPVVRDPSGFPSVQVESVQGPAQRTKIYAGQGRSILGRCGLMRKDSFSEETPRASDREVL